MELLILLLILAVLGIGAKGNSNRSSSRLMTFPDGDRNEDLIDKVCIKGGYQEVTPNPPPDPVDCGEWGTKLP